MIFSTGNDFALTANFKLKNDKLELDNGDLVPLCKIRLILHEIQNNSAIEWRTHTDIECFEGFKDLVNHQCKREYV